MAAKPEREIMQANNYAVQFTLKSTNTKTGPIPVSTTSRNTCPTDCPLRAAGCYAENGPLGAIWRGLTKAGPGGQFTNGRNTLTALTWKQFIAGVTSLAAGTLWRHNQAGDLPGAGNEIDRVALNQLVKANEGKRGFTYTHKPVTEGHNGQAIANANAAGFTINLSADNLTEADELAETGIGPVVVVLPETVSGNAHITTPQGRRVVVCPATYRDDTSCFDCQLCQRRDRPVIVGFPAHGASKKRASAIAQG
jgi:hypothetical protein